MAAQTKEVVEKKLYLRRRPSRRDGDMGVFLSCAGSIRYLPSPSEFVVSAGACKHDPCIAPYQDPSTTSIAMGVDIGGSKGQELDLITLSNAHHSVNTGHITRMLGSVAHLDKLP
jgi:hypothetical protein